MSRWKENLQRNLFALEDEANPASSGLSGIWPETTLDAVIDQQDPLHKTLREILDDLHQEILTGGQGTLVFPVTSVNQMTGDVVITPATIGLGLVDNTRDVDKPLSTPQRNAINDILKNYNFRVNLDELYNHLKDTNNPHAVSIDDLNKDAALETFIRRFVSVHNYDSSLNTHPDIRNSLISILSQFDSLKDEINSRINTMSAQLYQHMSEPTAHQELFDKKENTSNKVTSFSVTENASYSKYPSTRAVVEHVTSRLNEFKSGLPNITNWIDDLIVVKNRDELPDPTIQTYRKAAFIVDGNNHHEELAICKLENGKYRWDYEDLGLPTVYDPTYFTETSDGLSLQMKPIVDALLGEGELYGKTLQEILSNYYNKDEIDRRKWVHGLHIISGQDNGCIRFYINDDPSTVSNDIRVAGLSRIAFLEYVTENEIFDQAVHERHILNNAIVTRHIRDKQVTAKKVACKYGHVIGNSLDKDGNQANEVPMYDLANAIPLDRIKEIVDEAWKKMTGDRFGIIMPPTIRWMVGSAFNSAHLYDVAYPKGLEEEEISAITKHIVDRWYSKYDVKGGWVTDQWSLEIFTTEEVSDIVDGAFNRYFWILEKVEAQTLATKDLVLSQFTSKWSGLIEDICESISDQILTTWWDQGGLDNYTPNYDTLEPFTELEIQVIIDKVFQKAAIE